ncbi:MAG: N-(5'-phosphoribosyl)anthranilate isomerase, partial [Pseudomonadota bacterium]
MDLWPRDMPYILSGGLNMDNVADALLKTGASGIDISSGVERSPGQKDENLIRRFLQIVKKEDERVE